MARVYLKPGDKITAFFVDLVVIQEAKGRLGYAISFLGDSELKYFPKEPESPRDEDGYGIRYAWDLDPKDKYCGKPYYEREL